MYCNNLKVNNLKGFIGRNLNKAWLHRNFPKKHFAIFSMGPRKLLALKICDWLFNLDTDPDSGRNLDVYIDYVFLGAYNFEVLLSQFKLCF